MGNGLGPWWFPKVWRTILTKISMWFFVEADWQHHDEGYSKGSPSRAMCDKKFLQAMLRDASTTSAIWKIWACVVLAGFYWAMVRIFGALSYNRK
jgi:hypothetical protein